MNGIICVIRPLRLCPCIQHWKFSNNYNFVGVFASSVLQISLIIFQYIVSTIFTVLGLRKLFFFLFFCMQEHFAWDVWNLRYIFGETHTVNANYWVFCEVVVVIIMDSDVQIGGFTRKQYSCARSRSWPQK